jgi:uncharacterized coiled-coil protein SlyX
MSATTTTTAARLAALEARVATQATQIEALETINARLIHAMSRFTAIFDNHSLAITELMVDEFSTRDQEAAQTAAELAAAIRSRAPRGFKIPITVVENVFRRPDDRTYFRSWTLALHNLEWRGGRLESLLLRKGLIDNNEHSELTVPHRLDPEPEG